MTNVSAVEKMAELMQQMEENSPRVAALQYCLKQVAEKVEEAEKRNAELEARCAALAAELSSVLTDRAVILEDLDNTCFEIGMQRGEKAEAYRTPVVANHDAFLAEVRAQGVEMFAAHKRERQQALRSRSMRMSEEAAGMAADAENFADELRKGVQS
ncbi:hypothetical protein M8S88_05905 [Enterobacter hormaechei]|nr:hypothetical protein [Enterobacter hormaechei]